MKLAFTTLGCPEWNMDTIISKALEYDFDGVDFRGYLEELDLSKLSEFTTKAEDTAQRFVDANLEVSCFSSSARLFSKMDSEINKHIEELKFYISLCKQFHTHFIRVFGGAIGDTPRAQAIDIVAENLKTMVTFAEDHDVKILIETHDDWLDCEHLKSVMEIVDSGSAGILWDIHHPYRMIDEEPSKTWQIIGKWIQYTHWKDSFVKDNSHQLCLVGEGDIPLEEIFCILKNGNYNGYLTLEWEKRWHPEIEKPEIAFPAYVKFMKKLLSKQ